MSGIGTYSQPYVIEGEERVDHLRLHEPSWLNRLRRAALYDFHQRGFPGGKLEAWKHTRLNHLQRQRYHLAVPPRHSSYDIALPWLAKAKHRLVMVNGCLNKHLSQFDGMPEGMSILTFRQALERQPELLQTLWMRQFQAVDDGLKALNLGLINSGVVIQLDDECVLDSPLHIIHLTDVDTPSAAMGLVMLKLGRSAQLSLLESFNGVGGADYFSNTHAVVELANGASMVRYKLQNESPQASHFSLCSVHQAEASQFHSFSLGLGGSLMRDEMAVQLEGAGAECYLNGLFIADEQRHHDFHLEITHQAPNCLSREFYRGIADHRGHGVFDGTVVVKPHAQHSDAVMGTKNLLLSPHAEIDAKPRLEIYADDVKCAHGATVGQVDDAALFYLRSRGLDADGARGLLTFAFVNEVLDKIEDAEIRNALRTVVVAQLPHREAIKEGLWL